MIVCILFSASSAYAGEPAASAAAESKQSESVQTCGNPADFSAAVRSNMLARNTVFSIKYNGSSPGKVLTLDNFR